MGTHIILSDFYGKFSFCFAICIKVTSEQVKIFYDSIRKIKKAQWTGGIYYANNDILL